jgi:hypothetical protein
MLQSMERSRFLGKRGETMLDEILGKGRRRDSRSGREEQWRNPSRFADTRFSCTGGIDPKDSSRRSTTLIFSGRQFPNHSSAPVIYESNAGIGIRWSGEKAASVMTAHIIPDPKIHLKIYARKVIDCLWTIVVVLAFMFGRAAGYILPIALAIGFNTIAIFKRIYHYLTRNHRIDGLRN